jgi:hypothetical protein
MASPSAASLGRNGRPSDTSQIRHNQQSYSTAPQYTLLIRDWKTDVETGADAFAFQPPAEAKKVEFKALRQIDEVPPGAIKGEIE